MTTPAADDAVEQAFEALLAGRPVPSEDGGLVAFTEAVRASATAPGRPSAALAQLLATGLLTDQPGPSTRPARTSRRRRSRMLAPALFSKLAAAGLAAKAATVTGVAVVGLTTVGFTGNLGPAQHTFATLVDHATPFSAPDRTHPLSSDDGTQTGDEPVTTPLDTSQPATSTETSGDASTADPSESGDDASKAAAPSGEDTSPAQPSNYGQQVSQWAHDKKKARESGASVPAKPTKASSGDDVSGDHSSGDDVSGDDSSADDSSVEGSSGDNSSGDDSSGDNSSADDSSDSGTSTGDSSDGDSSGRDSSGRDSGDDSSQGSSHGSDG